MASASLKRHLAPTALKPGRCGFPQPPRTQWSHCCVVLRTFSTRCLCASLVPPGRLTPALASPVETKPGARMSKFFSRHNLRSLASSRSPPRCFASWHETTVTSSTNWSARSSSTCDTRAERSVRSAVRDAGPGPQGRAPSASVHWQRRRQSRRLGRPASRDRAAAASRVPPTLHPVREEPFRLVPYTTTEPPTAEARRPGQQSRHPGFQRQLAPRPDFLA